MPIKDADPYLKDALESIINQSHTDWELLAVNDHSNDKTVQILNHFSEKDQRIIVHHNQGDGIVDALTLAEKMSSGDWVSRMDADDLMEKDKLSKLLAAIKDKNEISTSYVKYISDNVLGDGYKKYESWLNQLIDSGDHYQHIYKECVLPSPNWMMHKDTLRKLGGFSSLSYPEDYDLCFKAYRQNLRIKGVKEVLHYWRDYPNRTSREDENYQDNAFLPLKVKYFQALDYDSSKKLLLWGAGRKGKKLAKLLLDHKMKFNWITNNPNKLFVPIYGLDLIHSKDILNEPMQAIIAVAGPTDQNEIHENLENLSNIDPFWFC